jgi:hypothetical protein
MATRAGKVDPQDARRVKHSRIGVWDLYEERPTDNPGSSILETYARIRESLPYVVRMLKDILSIRRVRILLPIFLVVEVLGSLTPAVSMWYAYVCSKAASFTFTTSLRRYFGQLLRFVMLSMLLPGLPTYLAPRWMP